jgi:protein-S-isoprenylcysteine O-methyltransferase
MTLPSLYVLGPLWGAAELGVAAMTHARSESASKDRGSFLLIWTVSFLSIGSGILVAYKVRWAAFPHPKLLYLAGLSFFALGLVLRIFSMIYLGRFFTPNVAIITGHRLIDSGPYRFIRHPTYSGFLLILLRLGFACANAASLVIIFIPASAALLWRIQIEERALIEAFGEDYQTYAARTKRLIPFVY